MDTEHMKEIGVLVESRTKHLPDKKSFRSSSVNIWILSIPSSFPNISYLYQIVLCKILPIALWSWGRLSLWQKWVPGAFPGGKGGRCLRLTTYHHPVPLSCNLETLTSCNPLGHSGPVMGLLYLYLSTFYCFWQEGYHHDQTSCGPSQQ